MNLYRAYHESPIGLMKIEATDAGVSSIGFVESIDEQIIFNDHVEKCVQQLKDYFDGELKTFDLDLDLEGTTFQKTIWNLLLEIESGTTCSYMDIAKKYGDVKAIRAVGTTNGKNPISIVVPCHRVIGSDGSLTGYASGLQRKKWLLDHEKRMTGVYQADLFE